MSVPVGAAAAVPRPHRPGLCLTWLGHATVLLELDRRRVLTDPLLRPRIAHLTRRPGDVPSAEELRPHVILCSHAHRDHFDPPSLRALPSDAVVIAPRGLGRRIERLGFREVVEVVVGDEVPFGDLRIHATHAEHARGRGLPWSGPVPVGYRIEGTHAVYFPGDTDLFAGMSAIGDGLDLALLPVGGWGPRIPAGHLDPKRAAEALRLLRPRFAVPIHWGTYLPVYRRRPYAGDTNAGSRFAALARLAAPEVDVRVLVPGERRELV